MKRLIPCIGFLFGNEILSCIILMIYAAMLIWAILKAAEGRGM